MITLYVKDGCVFSKQVLNTARELEFQFTEKNLKDEDVKDELAARAGHTQVPYLVDDEAHIEMHESDAIVQYLIAEYAAKHI